LRASGGGVVRLEGADVYAEYIRDTGDRTEFLTLSLWDSLDAIRAFAGDDIEAAVLYPEGARYLIGESTVTRYQVVDQVEDPSRPGEER
jgi:heme-degrading monooxygenase HmoA